MTTLAEYGSARHSPRGFTLIEVLAALAVVSLGMLGVIEAVSQTVSNSGYLKDKTLAHWIAMNQLTQLRLSGSTPAEGKTQGELAYADQKWRWNMEVTETGVESMRRIDIFVRRDTSPEGSSLAAITGFMGAAMERPGATRNVVSMALIPNAANSPANANGAPGSAPPRGSPPPGDNGSEDGG